METLPLPFRIDFGDGTFGNFIKAGPMPPQHHLLENISGMKYGRKNTENHTRNILEGIKKNYPTIISSAPQILHAAESVLIHHYANKKKTILLYDLDRDEYILYVLDGQKSIKGQAIRITRMLRGIIDGKYLQDKDMFVDAVFDFKSVQASLKYDMEEAVKTEDYEHAAIARDVIAATDKNLDERAEGRKKNN